MAIRLGTDIHRVAASAKFSTFIMCMAAHALSTLHSLSA